MINGMADRGILGKRGAKVPLPARIA